MARSRRQTISLSDDPKDKRCACMNHEWLSIEYEMAPDYFDACARWYNSLTPAQQKDGRRRDKLQRQTGALATLAGGSVSGAEVPDRCGGAVVA